MTELEIYKEAIDTIRDWRNQCIENGFYSDVVHTYPDGRVESYKAINAQNRTSLNDKVIDDLDDKITNKSL